MEISNRLLVASLVAMLFLVSVAAWLILDPRPVDAISGVGNNRAEVALDDAPPAPPMVSREGGHKIEASGPLTIRRKRGEKAEQVQLVCLKFKSERLFFDAPVEFKDIPVANCGVSLLKADDAEPFRPVFPGDEITCELEGKVTRCTGGLAAKEAGTVTVTSELAGSLEVDGDDLGILPLEDLKISVGSRALVVRLEDGRTIDWNLLVNPEEKILVEFSAESAPKIKNGATPESATKLEDNAKNGAGGAKN